MKDWAEQWKMAAEQLLGVAETMPAEKYDYKPVKEVGALSAGEPRNYPPV